MTSTPLPQQPPQNPSTPLDAARLASILHGEATVEDMLKTGDAYQLAQEIRRGLDLTDSE